MQKIKDLALLFFWSFILVSFCVAIFCLFFGAMTEILIGGL